MDLGGSGHWKGMVGDLKFNDSTSECSQSTGHCEGIIDILDPGWLNNGSLRSLFLVTQIISAQNHEVSKQINDKTKLCFKEG